MSIPPEGFLEEFERMRTHFDWAHRNMTSGNVDIPQAKLVIEEWQEFIAKWLHRIKEEEVVAGIKAADKIMQELHRALERLQLEHLQIVLAARRDWHVAELIFKAIVACSEIVKVTPPHLLPELLKILSDGVGEEFDAAKEYRECEANAEQAEAKYRRELTRYECDWPERTDEAMRNRLLNLSADDFKASDEELAKALGQQQQSQ